MPLWGVKFWCPDANRFEMRISPRSMPSSSCEIEYVLRRNCCRDVAALGHRLVSSCERERVVCLSCNNGCARLFSRIRSTLLRCLSWRNHIVILSSSPPPSAVALIKSLREMDTPINADTPISSLSASAAATGAARWEQISLLLSRRIMRTVFLSLSLCPTCGWCNYNCRRRRAVLIAHADVVFRYLQSLVHCSVFV